MFFFTHLGCTFHAVKSKLANRFSKFRILVKAVMILFKTRLDTFPTLDMSAIGQLFKMIDENPVSNTSVCVHLHIARRREGKDA